MGLGINRSPWADYEMFHLPSWVPPVTETRTFTHLTALDAPEITALHPDDTWEPDTTRVLLVDLDNMRARSTRWKLRLEAVLAMAADADHVVLAGQRRNVDPVLPHLGAYASQVIIVKYGANLADYALLEAARTIRARKGRPLQFAVTSNDHIFGRLARRGKLTIVSPCVDQISLKLLSRAHSVVDLQIAEGAARKVRRPATSAAAR